MIMDDFNVMEGESIFSSLFSETHKEVIEELFDKLMIDGEESAKTLEYFTDYRTYMDYDIRITGSLREIVTKRSEYLFFVTVFRTGPAAMSRNLRFLFFRDDPIHIAGTKKSAFRFPGWIWFCR